MNYPEIFLLASIAVYIVLRALARSEAEAKLVAALVSLLRANLSLLAQMIKSVVIVLREVIVAYLRLNPRVLIGGALILLFIANLILILGGKAVAEQLGVYAYYFLIGGILLLFIQFVREGSGER